MYGSANPTNLSYLHVYIIACYFHMMCIPKMCVRFVCLQLRALSIRLLHNTHRYKHTYAHTDENFQKDASNTLLMCVCSCVRSPHAFDTTHTHIYTHKLKHTHTFSHTDFNMHQTLDSCVCVCVCVCVCAAASALHTPFA